MAGFFSIGNEHGKISDELMNEGNGIHKWRHNQSETKRKIIAEGKAHYAEILTKQKNLEKHKSYVIYICVYGVHILHSCAYYITV